VKDWWLQLQARERMLALTGAAGLAVLLIWSMLWLPLQRERAKLQERITVMTADVGWIQAQITTLQAVPTRPTSSAGSALSVVEDGLKQARLDANLKQLTPVGEGRVRVALEGVSFNALSDWLEQTARQHGLGAEELSARKVAPGAVDVEFVLVAGAG